MLRRDVADVVRYEYQIPVSIKKSPSDPEVGVYIYPAPLGSGYYSIGISAPLFDVSHEGLACEDVKREEFTLLGTFQFEVGDDGDVVDWRFSKVGEDISAYGSAWVEVRRLPNIRRNDYGRGGVE
jgi:hypothetical protein